MSSHHRTDSESSYEFVKTEVETLLSKGEKEEKSEEVLSLKDEVSSNGSASSDSDLSFSESEEEEEKVEETIDQIRINEKSETSSMNTTENMIGDSMGLTVEIPETMEKPVSEELSLKIDEKLIMENRSLNDVFVDFERRTIQSDPLGVTETPIIGTSVISNQESLISPEEPKTEALFVEMSLLRCEVEKIKQVQEHQNKKIAEIQKKLDSQQEAEREKELKRYSPITTAIRGEWRLLNLAGQNENMKVDGFSLANRVRSLVSHTVYDFDGTKLTSHQRLFCKMFGHSTMPLGTERTMDQGNLFSTTFLRGNMLITVWKDERGVINEKKERYVMDGQLYISHINRFGERNTMVYEKVKSKCDYLASFGNATRLYLKFW